MPTGGPAPLVAAAEAHYPVRADFLAVAAPAAVPPRLPSAGNPPLRSLQLGAKAFDADFAAQLKPGLGKTIINPHVIPAPYRDDLSRLLDAYFGTPAAPAVRLPSVKAAEKIALNEIDSRKKVRENWQKVFGRAREWNEAADAIRELNLTDAALARGAVLYRRSCLMCHGETGAGNGEHALHVGAMPRDYRQGQFKFITAFPTEEQPRKGEKGKPRKADLKRTIRNGLDGSMMPPFSQFTDADLDDLAGYVVHLAARGEVEFDTIVRANTLILSPSDEDPEFNAAVLEQIIDTQTPLVVGNWGRADRSPIPIPPEEISSEEERWESSVRGYKAFTGRGCLGCHDNYGRTPSLKYDAWATVVQPRNLVLGVYRGGRRGEDLYARVYGGIVPSTMPDYLANLKLNPPVPGKPDEVWDVVHFLQALADPRGRDVLTQRLKKEKEKDPGLNLIPFD